MYKGFVKKINGLLGESIWLLLSLQTGVEVKGLDDIIGNIYSRTRPVWTRLSSYDWSRFMTPEWYKEISPEVSSWFSSTDKFDLRDWLKSFESSESTTSWDKADWGSVDSTMRDILSKVSWLTVLCVDYFEHVNNTHNQRNKTFELKSLFY